MVGLAVPTPVGAPHRAKGGVQGIHNKTGQRQPLLRGELRTDPPVLRTVVGTGTAQRKFGCYPQIPVLTGPRPESGAQGALRQFRKPQDVAPGPIARHPDHGEGPDHVAQHRLGGRPRSQPGQVVGIFDVGIAEEKAGIVVSARRPRHGLPIGKIAGGHVGPI